MFSKGIIAYDTETTGLNPWHGDAPFLFAFCDTDLRASCIEVDVDPYTRIPALTSRALRETHRRLSAARTVVMHNAKFDVRMTDLHGSFSFLGKPIHDTMFMAHCANSLEPSIGLKPLSKRLLSIPDDDEQELLEAVRSCRRIASKLGWNVSYRRSEKADGTIEKKAQVQADYWLPRAIYKHNNTLVPKRWARLCSIYALKDARRTMELFLFLDRALDDLPGARQAYVDEMATWWTVYRMESRGVRVHPRETAKQICRLKRIRSEKLRSLRQSFRRHCPSIKSPNLESNRHIARLVESLDIRIEKRTKTGLACVDAESLQGYRDNDSIADLLNFKSACKGLASFLLRFKEWSVPDDIDDTVRCIKPQFRQVGPATRRFACASPNLQNVADDKKTRSTGLVQARSSFGPRPGHVWLCYDYEQLESRIFASVADEQFMLEAFAKGRDLHAETANRLWGGRDSMKALTVANDLLKIGNYDRRSKASNELLVIWKKLGITHDNRQTLTRLQRVRLANRWLELNDYRVSDCEKCLGLSNLRVRAKGMFFGKLFGMGIPATMTYLHVSRQEAIDVLDEYDDAFPRIGEYMNECSARAEQEGYIIDAYGHRINVHPDYGYRSVNYRVQGSAASHLKRAMRRCDLMLRSRRIDGHIVLCIHDEIIFEIERSQVTRGLMLRLKAIMEDDRGVFPGVDTPVSVDVCYHRWDKKEKLSL